MIPSNTRDEAKINKPFALIIDDDRDIVALFRHVLDLSGYHTEIILHGKAAVERLSTSQPDIILLDLNLPGVPGAEILHFIRSQERLKDTQVIVITAHAHIAQTLEEEPDLVLLKPVNIEQLINLVNRLRPTEKQTSHESPLDELTGFYNRSFFKSRLDYSLARLKQLDLSHFTVLLANLDPLPSVESAWIVNMARAIKSILRPTDTIAHFDGCKFAILIEDVRHWDIPIVLANRILTQVGRYLGETNIRACVNIGIILCHVGYADVDDILRDAEASLSLAKAQGTSGYQFFARDNFNNAYDLDMISDMISLVGAEPLRNQLKTTKMGIRVRQIEISQPSLQVPV